MATSWNSLCDVRDGKNTVEMWDLGPCYTNTLTHGPTCCASTHSPLFTLCLSNLIGTSRSASISFALTHLLLNILNPPPPHQQRSAQRLSLRCLLVLAAASYHHCLGSLHCLPDLHANVTVIGVAAMMM